MLVSPDEVEIREYTKNLSAMARQIDWVCLPKKIPVVELNLEGFPTKDVQLVIKAYLGIVLGFIGAALLCKNMASSLFKKLVVALVIIGTAVAIQ